MSAHVFGAFVNDSRRLRDGRRRKYPLVVHRGREEPFQAELDEFMGSDNELYAEGSYRIPAIYLQRLARPLHPHELRHGREHRCDRAPARGLHRAASALFLANMKSSSC